MSTPASVRRSTEAFALFNPGFIAALLARAVEGHIEESGNRPLLPIVRVGVAVALDSDTRSSLTMNIRTNLGAWKYEHPRAFLSIARLYDFHDQNIRSGLILGLSAGVLSINEEGVGLGDRPLRRRTLSGFSDDVNLAQRTARYMGRWLSKSGSPATVLALLGIRP